MAIAPNETTLKVIEAAKLLGISRNVAYELAKRGELPGARRLGGRVIVLRAVLEAYLRGENPAPE